MMETDYLVPAGLFLLCLGIRVGYEILKDAGKINKDSTLTFALILASMCVLWASWFDLCPKDPYRVDVPGFIRWSGFSLFVLGMILAVGAFVQLRGVENIKHLVTTGLFRKLRHPMYLGFILWIIGWSVYHGALLSLTIGAVGIASTLWWRYLEDGRLMKQFGDDYRHYRDTTWF